MSNEVVPTLDFDEKFQAAVIGHMLNDYLFFIQCEGQLDYRSFHNPYHQQIVEVMYDLYRRGDKGLYRQAPTKDPLLEELYLKYNDYENKKSYYAAVMATIEARESIPIAMVQRHMTGWLKSLKIRDLMQRSLKLFNDRRYEEAEVSVERHLEQVKSANFYPEDRVLFTDLMNFYQRREEELNEDCCTIGHWKFDELIRKGSGKTFTAQGNDNSWKILRGSTAGSLAPGGSTVILGATNSGKTTFIISIIAANLMMGKRVLLVTHEQMEEDIKAKIVECLAGMSTQQVINLVRTDEKKAQDTLRQAERVCETYLTYIPWIKTGSMHVEKVVSIIQHQQELMKAKLTASYEKMIKEGSSQEKADGKKLLEKNRGFDLVVDDYPKKLRAMEFRNRTISEHDEIQYVYAQFVNMAREEKFHTILPAQGNREAFKVATRGDADRMLDLGDGAGSYGLMHEVDNVISINRKKSDAASEVVKFYLTKCRLNAVGSVFISKTDMAASRMIGPHLAWQVKAPGETVSDELISSGWANIEKQKADNEKQQQVLDMLGNDKNKIIEIASIARVAESGEVAFGHREDGTLITDPTELEDDDIKTDPSE